MSIVWCNVKKELIIIKLIESKECFCRRIKVKIHLLISLLNLLKDYQKMFKLKNVGWKKVNNLLKKIKRPFEMKKMGKEL